MYFHQPLSKVYLLHSCDISSGYLYPCFPLLGHLGLFSMLSNFPSLLGLAFAVKAKAENRVGLCKGVEKVESKYRYLFDSMLTGVYFLFR